MAVYAKKVGFFSPTSTGDQEITDVGFQPKAIIFYGTNSIFGGPSAGHMLFHYGVTLSTSSRVVVSFDSRDNHKNHQKGKYHDNANCIKSTNYANTVQYAADLSSMDANGFTLTWTTVGLAYLQQALCIGGDVEVALETITTPGSTGTVAYTGAGFTPDYVQAFTVWHNAAPPSGTTGNASFSLGHGVGTASGDQFAIGGWPVDAGSTSTASRYQNTGTLIALPATDGSSLSYAANIDSIDENGVTLDWTAATTSGFYCYLLYIKGGEHKVGTITQPSTATTTNTGDIEYTPISVFNFGTADTALDTLRSDETIFQIGCATNVDAIEHGASVVRDQTKASGDSNAVRATSGNAALIHYAYNATALTVGHINTLSASGIEYDFTAVDGNENYIAYWAFGANQYEGSGGVTMGGTPDIFIEFPSDNDWDTFIDEDGTELENHITDVGEATWMEHSGDWEIEDNEVTLNGTTGVQAATFDSQNEDSIVELEAVMGNFSGTNKMGAIIRSLNGSNFWAIVLDAVANQLQILKNEADSVSTEATASMTVTPEETYLITADAEDNTITATAEQLTGGNASATTDVTDSFGSDNTRIGLYVESSDTITRQPRKKKIRQRRGRRFRRRMRGRVRWKRRPRADASFDDTPPPEPGEGGDGFEAEKIIKSARGQIRKRFRMRKDVSAGTDSVIAYNFGLDRIL